MVSQNTDLPVLPQIPNFSPAAIVKLTLFKAMWPVLFEH
jgi:hypothetical protein